MPPLKKRKIGTSSSTRKPVAQRIRMKAVTPRAIAYTCVHLHFALSSASVWTNEYEGFDYVQFYNFIIDHFEKPLGPSTQRIRQDLLAWWTQMIFPRKSKSAPQKVGRNSRAKLEEQRRRLGGL